MIDIVKHVTITTHCGHCGREINAATNADGSKTQPVKGDLSVCLYCAGVNIYDEHQQLTAVLDVDTLGLDYETFMSIKGAIELVKRNIKYIKPE